MLLIINPYIEWDDTQYSKSDLNVYLDNSKSMLAVSNDFLFNDEIKKIFDWSDENQVKINMYLFGDSLREYQFNNNLIFSDKNSSIEDISNNIVINENTTHLIITDGHVNKGKSMESLFLNSNSDILLAGVGDEFDENDCYVKSVNLKYLDFGFIDVITKIGCDTRLKDSFMISVKLINYDDVTVSSKDIKYFQRDGYIDVAFNNLSVSDFYSLNQILITSNIDEYNIDNNQKYFTVKSNQDSTKGLLISGALSNNTKFLKELMNNKFPDMEMDYVISSEDINLSSLKQYSFIVFDNFPSENQHLKDFNYIIDNFSDIPMIYFEGPGLNINIGKHIAESLVVDLYLNDSVEDELLVECNSSICRNIDFDKISPSKKYTIWSTNDYSNSNPISFFNHKESDIRTISAIKNKRKFSSVFIPNMASISLIEKHTYNSNNFINYIYSVMLYEYDSLTNLIKLDIEDIKHSTNSIINASIELSQNLEGMNLYMIVNNLESDKQDTLYFSKSNLLDYSYQFNIEEAGSYSVEVIAEDSNSKYSSNSEYIVLSDIDFESQFLYQNKKSLINFKDNNNAYYFDFSNLELELKNIVPNEIIIKNKKNINSLSSQYYWVILILLFALEWYLRKKSKLL